MVAQDEMFEKTDKEIYEMALADWYGVLASMWTLIAKPVDPERLRIYGKNLSAVPLGLLEIAINRVFRENTYQIVPVPGIIWESIKKELHNPYDIDTALENWCPVHPPSNIPIEWRPSWW